MADVNSIDESSYRSELSIWHGELSNISCLIKHVVSEFIQATDGDSIPPWILAASVISSDKLSALVETFPFPPRSARQ